MSWYGPKYKHLSLAAFPQGFVFFNNRVSICLNQPKSIKIINSMRKEALRIFSTGGWGIQNDSLQSQGEDNRRGRRETCSHTPADPKGSADKV